MKAVILGKRGLVSTVLVLCGLLIVVVFCYAQTKKYPPLTDWDLKNADYYLEDATGKVDAEPYKVNNGVWYYQKPSSENENYVEMIDVRKTAHGELNGDGNRDGATIIVWNDYGANGFFVYVSIFLNDKGKAKNVATKFIGDRCPIEKFYIKGGSVYIQVIMRFNDNARWLLKYTVKNGTVVKERVDLGKAE
jgi:hypothetical protein